MLKSFNRLAASWGGVLVFGLFAMAFAWQFATIQTLRQAPVQKTEQSGAKWKVGDKLPVLPAKLLGGDGSEQPIDLSGTTTLYVWSPGCDWCTRNLDNAKALQQAAGKFVSIAAMPYGVKEYVDLHGITYPVYYGAKNLGITKTPYTLVVKDGVVSQLWGGAWTPEGESRVQIEKYFGIVLPGLRQE